MARGRKRKAGAREPNGQPERQTAWQTKAPVLERRCKHLGMQPTLENMRRVDRFGGTMWGLLHLGGAITLRQHEAAREFAEMLARYDQAMNLPRRVPAIMDLLTVRGRSLTDMSPEKRRHAIDSFRVMQDALGDSMMTDLISCALEMVPNVLALQAALNQVADHLEIEVAENA